MNVEDNNKASSSTPKKGKKKKKVKSVGSKKGEHKRKSSKKKGGSKRGGSNHKDAKSNVISKGEENGNAVCNGGSTLPLELWEKVLKVTLPSLLGARQGRERLRIMLVCRDWHSLVWTLTTEFDYEDKPLEYLKLLTNKKKTRGSLPMQQLASHLKPVDDELFSWFVTSSFASLTTLALSHCDRLTDEGLKGLANLPRLTRLSLAYLPANDASVGSVLSGLKELRCLALTQTDALQGGFLQQCTPSTLEELDLTEGKALTVSGLAPLADLTRLTSLVMVHCGSGVNCNIFESLPPSLERLKVSGFLLLEKAVTRLSEQPKLRELALSFTFFNQKRLAALALLTSLKRLDAIDVREASFLEEIGSLVELDHLRIVARFYATRFGTADLAPLAQLSGLTSLSLDTSGPENDGLSYLSNMHNLTSVILSIPINFTSFRFLKDLPSLRTLHVVRCEAVKDKAFRKLTSLTELHTTCDDPERKGIENLTRLQTLSFDNCRICSLRFVTHLSSLTTLRITACRSLTDQHVQELVLAPSTLPHTLTLLDLSFCGSVSDASTPHILQLTSLMELRLLGSNFSSENLGLLDLRLPCLTEFAYPKRAK